MKHLLASLAFYIVSAVVAFAGNIPEQVIIHCAKPGTLSLPREAHMTERLKITGKVNAVDFRTLKGVTIMTTSELDLSEVDIEAYTGANGSYEQLMDDWFIGNPEVVEYPADFLPIDAFCEERDNSLHKWREPSNSLRSIILPSSLKGVMRRTLNDPLKLKEIRIADGAALKVENGVALFSADGSVMYSLLPSFHGHITMPSELNKIADGALENSSPASLAFRSDKKVTVGDGNASFKCAYITSPIPEYYSTIFKDIDCFENLVEIKLHCSGGDLLENLAALDLGRNDIRNVTLSGCLNRDEVEWLMKLPNLHRLDLHGIEDLGISTLEGTSLTDFVFPPSVIPSTYLTINAPFLQGEVNVSEGVYFIQCQNSVLNRVTLPASLEDFCWTNNFYRQPVEYLDMSRCIGVRTIESLDECPFLETLLLPPYLSRLIKVKSPLRQIELPETLTRIEDCRGWEVEELTLPSSLEKFELSDVPRLKRLNIPECPRLESFKDLNHSPFLEELDLSRTAVRKLELFNGTHHISPEESELYDSNESRAPQKRIVVTGGTRNPKWELCGIKNLVLPSSLTDVSGLNYCDFLEELDFSDCGLLTSIGIGSNCSNLKKVTLPYSVQKVTGLDKCPDLRELIVCAEMPPTIAGEGLAGEISRITVTVPTGKRTLYRMSEVWDEAAEIIEGGHNVVIGRSSEAPAEMVTGAGLYQPGTVVNLAARAVPGRNNDSLVPTGWRVDGQNVEGASIAFQMPANKVDCNVVYASEMNTPDILITFRATTDTQVIAWNDLEGVIGGNSTVYLDGATVRIGTPYNKKIGRWDVTAGEHSVRVYGTPGALSLGVDPENHQVQDEIEILSYTQSEACETREITFGRVDMDRLVLPKSSNLRYLTVYSGRLKDLDASPADRMEGIVVENCGLQKLQLGEKPVLWQLGLYNNALTSIDLTQCPELEILNCSDNVYEIASLDDTGCFDLAELSVYGLDLTKITSVSKPLYGSKISFINTEGDVDHQPVTYDYNAGSGHSVTFNLKCIVDSWSAIKNTAPATEGSIVVDGRKIIVEGFSAPVRIMTVGGTVIATFLSDGAMTVPSTGIYLVNSGTAVWKIAVTR